jgi:acyl-CoA thioesterase-2
MQHTPHTNDLLALLCVHPLSTHRFQGNSVDPGWGRVFGGQVLAQACSAAYQTAPEQRLLHSLHCFFMEKGDVNLPIEYHVDSLRDGRSFSTRAVKAIQKNKEIFHMLASFHHPGHAFDYQHATMPNVPPPESLKNEPTLAQTLLDPMPDYLRPLLNRPHYFETRPLEQHTLQILPQAPSAPTRTMWIKYSTPLPPQNTALAHHHILLAYISDQNFLNTILKPHGLGWLDPHMQMASIDHAMWFHAPFRVDDWFLFTIESPRMAAERGLVRGQFFDRAGALFASANQEGLIRRG